MALQWALMAGFLALTAIAALAGALWKRVRPTAFAVGFLSMVHAAYYAFFLIWPDILGPYATMLFSISTRWVVLFVALLVLGMAVWRERWRA